MVERPPCKRMVGGSNPSSGTIFLFFVTITFYARSNLCWTPGSGNLLDNYPDKNLNARSGLGNLYSQYAPAGLNGRFILTGSSSPALIAEISETLAGRVAIVELGTFKSNEYYGYSDMKWSLQCVILDTIPVLSLLSALFHNR